VLGERARCDVVVVSDYAKGVIGPHLLAALAAAHARAPFTWVVDPKRANFAHYRRASLMKPNRAEAAEAAGIEIRDRPSLCAVGARLLERWETEAVLISRGDEGMALFKRGGAVQEFPTVAREVYDVTGAGDTVLAACALALGAGGTPEEATVLANHAAGVVVGKIGTATLGADELRAALREGRPPPRDAEPRAAVAARRGYAVVVRAELARAYVAAARRLGRRLGLEGDVALVDVLRLPDVFEVSEEPPELRRELPALRRALARALGAFDRERRREGGHLRRDMLGRAAALRRATAAIRRRLPHALAALRNQVEERLVRLVGGAELDRGRVAQEVAMLAERSDVTEEVVRLEGHLGALARALGERGPVGKRIEFLLQEIQRELNTTGAKAGDREITDLVLGAKAEVEKLREQVQN